MYFYDELTQENLCKEIDDICDSDSDAYPFERKAARLNAALDSYFHIAWMSNSVRRHDDLNNSSIPLEQQNIVSGTNSYKIDDFTVKMAGIIKVVVLDEGGIPTELWPETLSNLPGNFEELYGTYGQTETTGLPQYYVVVGDYIYLRPNPDYNYTNGFQVYGNRASSKFTYQRCTISVANPGVITASTAHGLSVNDTVIFRTTSALPTGLSADTLYYVKTVPSTTTFTVASTQGGTAIETTVAGSGEHAFVQANKTPGIARLYDHYTYLARKASLPYLSERGKSNLKDIASLVAMDERNIGRYFASKDLDLDNRVTFKQRCYK